MLDFRKILFVLFILLTGIINKAFALDVVYPKTSTVNIFAPSTFIVGNTDAKAKLTLNGKPVKVYPDGSFVVVVPLNNYKNSFILRSKSANKYERKVITVTKAKPQARTASTKYIPFQTNEKKYAKILADNIPIRTAPSDNATRLTHLSTGTGVYLDGKKGNFYKVIFGDEYNCWIKQNYVNLLINTNERTIASIDKANVYEDNDAKYLTMALSMPVAYQVKEAGNDISLTLFGINKNETFLKGMQAQKIFPTVILDSHTGDNMTLRFASQDKIWGYECKYINNELVLKIRKKPTLIPDYPLKGITIALDAGHGGKELGAVGPTRVAEKDINYKIAKKLEYELKRAGANVVQVREGDVYMSLAERQTAAQNSNALIALSIHANSLPDGQNPYIKHGTSVYYYNESSKELADTIKKSMTTSMSTKDDGTNKASFAMNRSTAPLSVLIETAYMINPIEYAQLQKNSFQETVAKSIREGLEQYLINNAK